MYVEEQEQIPWDTLNVMVSEITYGVRSACSLLVVVVCLCLSISGDLFRF